MVAMVTPLTRSSTAMVSTSSRYAIFLFSVDVSPPNAGPKSSSERAGGRSLMRTEMRCGFMCSVRHAPSVSLRPYSMSASWPAENTMHTEALSKKNFSVPVLVHGTSLSLQDSRSPISSVSGVCATR